MPLSPTNLPKDGEEESITVVHEEEGVTANRKRHVEVRATFSWENVQLPTRFHGDWWGYYIERRNLIRDDIHHQLTMNSPAVLPEMLKSLHVEKWKPSISQIRLQIRIIEEYTRDAVLAV